MRLSRPGRLRGRSRIEDEIRREHRTGIKEIHKSSTRQSQRVSVTKRCLLEGFGNPKMLPFGLRLEGIV